MENDNIILKVQGRKNKATLTHARPAMIARDCYMRLWVKCPETGTWNCYGSLVEAKGEEVPR
jgi:hypothetical protein